MILADKRTSGLDFLKKTTIESIPGNQEKPERREYLTKANLERRREIQ